MFLKQLKVTQAIKSKLGVIKKTELAEKPVRDNSPSGLL